MDLETRFHHLGKQKIKHSKPTETGFPTQTSQPAPTLPSHLTKEIWFSTTFHLREKPGFSCQIKNRYTELWKNRVSGKFPEAPDDNFIFYWHPFG
jgi:exo-beta-1,3-glucanase (GH17 family)